MGNKQKVKSEPDKNELNSTEQKAHDDIHRGLINARKIHNRIHKLLLLGTESSGKSTISRQLRCIYKDGFMESEYEEFVPIIRRLCISSIVTLLIQTQKFYQINEKRHRDDYIDINEISQDVLNAIKTVANMKGNDFED